ncbi:cytochrome c family protein [Massilia sp. ST3]|uniref:c-type cytochrome n=1 Tax=Massilia sp. ST3 TaxID=2824903 RepID=UPI001B820675|nr:cytochrome c family protein [Massilia sp. ST3]MBQ5946042.1 cytochrome c family protein [Massilia sp. ST3]
MRLARPAVSLLAALLAGCADERAPADPEAGRKVFARCANCHQVGPGARNVFGPELNGIVGRRAGSLPDYQYSPALRRAGFAWDEARLAAFLRDPDAVVPGNAMRFWGLSSERQLADLLAYLRTQPAR